MLNTCIIMKEKTTVVLRTHCRFFHFKLSKEKSFFSFESLKWNKSTMCSEHSCGLFLQFNTSVQHLKGSL